MSKTNQQCSAVIDPDRIADFPDLRYKTLYRVGGFSSILIAALLIFAIIAYFIWPFKPGLASTAEIFKNLHTDRLGGLMSLDLTFPIIVIFSILPLLAVYVALKQVDQSYAFIALVLGLAAALLLLPSRPLAELVLLSVLSVLVTQPILSAPDYLSKIAANENTFLLGALLVLTMGLPLALVPVLLYPILKRHDEILALAYVVFRGALEMVCYIVMTICWLFLILISQEAATTGAANLSAIQSLGAVFMKGNDSIANVLVIIFSLDALMLYTMLYRSQLIPRWISIWGFIAILMHFSTAFSLLFHLSDMNTASLINLPIFLQEIVMAVWMIAKGFNPKAVME